MKIGAQIITLCVCCTFSGCGVMWGSVVLTAAFAVCSMDTSVSPPWDCNYCTNIKTLDYIELFSLS